MSIFKRKKKGGFTDVIRCDEPSYLIWKWHPAGVQRGAGERENAIRYGSSLRVKDGSVAVFVYKQKNGTMQDFIEGPFDQIIKTKNFPVLAKIVGLAYEGGTPFQAEIYFINFAKVIQITFAVPYFEVYDPRFLDFGVDTAARGTLTFKIKDYREFIKLHRLDNFDLDDFQRQIRDVIVNRVKDAVANAPTDYNIPVVQLERTISRITDKIKPELSEKLEEVFGVELLSFDIAHIDIDKNCEGYLKLKTITQDIASATIKEQAKVNIKNLHDTQRINAENMEETLRIQREESQYAQHKASQSGNFAAYQAELQHDVGIAGAEAFGKISSNGGGTISGGGDMNPAAMMANIAIGGAIGQNIAGTMNEMMGGAQAPAATAQSGAVPPPIPAAGYHIAVNGQPTGPYAISAMAQMAASGMLTKDSLVWKQGMTEWKQARTVQEIQSIFSDKSSMPPIPPVK